MGTVDARRRTRLDAAHPHVAAHAAHGTVLTVGPTLRCSPADRARSRDLRRHARRLPLDSASPRIRLEALPDPSLPQGGPGRDYYGNFALTGFTVTAASARRGAGHARHAAEGRDDDGHVGGTSRPARSCLMKPARQRATCRRDGASTPRATTSGCGARPCSSWRRRSPARAGHAIVTLSFMGTPWRRRSDGSASPSRPSADPLRVVDSPRRDARRARHAGGEPLRDG